MQISQPPLLAILAQTLERSEEMLYLWEGGNSSGSKRMNELKYLSGLLTEGQAKEKLGKRWKEFKKWLKAHDCNCLTNSQGHYYQDDINQFIYGREEEIDD